jgi:hypothetical protein
MYTHIDHYSMEEINGFRYTSCTYPSLLCMYITYAIYVQAKKRKFMEKIARGLYVPDTQTLPLVTGYSGISSC